MFLNVLTIVLVSLPVVAAAWTFGGANARYLSMVMPWASLACVIGTFVLPQQRHDESSRRQTIARVYRDVLKDPFFWLAAAFLVYFAIPLFNVGLCANCDYEAIQAGANPLPPHPFLPFCVRASEHAGLYWLFGPPMLAALGIRHGLSRHGKRVVMEILVWNAAALSVLGFLQMLTGAQFPYWTVPPQETKFFSVFGYPNMGGAFFTFSYAISLGLWCRRIGEAEAVEKDLKSDNGTLLQEHYPFIAVVLNLAGALATLSRAAIVLVVALTAIFIIYVVLRAFTGRDWRRARRFKSAVTCLVMFLSLLGVVYLYAPPEVLREVKTVNTHAVAGRLSGKGQYHNRVATAIMRDYPIFGVGGWGYRHFQSKYMTSKELLTKQIDGGANVHNDYLQFLAEHGIVGFVLLCAMMYFLARPVNRAWNESARAVLKAERSGMSSSTSVIFSVKAPVLWSFLGFVAVLVHAFGDCPLRCGAVFSVVMTIPVLAFGYIPHSINEENDQKGGIIHDDHFQMG